MAASEFVDNENRGHLTDHLHREDGARTGRERPFEELA